MKKIIVLEKLESDLSFRCAFWLDVPAARQPYYANQSLASEYKDATGQEVSDIRDGKIIERVSTFNFSANAVVQVILDKLVEEYISLQSSITNFNPYQFYGYHHDGNSWVSGGVA